MSIEERSVEYSNSEYRQSDVFDRIAAKSAYFTGATEQQEIDIKKACDWLKQNTEQRFHDCRSYVETNRFETPLEFVERFRKAMEGE